VESLVMLVLCLELTVFLALVSGLSSENRGAAPIGALARSRHRPHRHQGHAGAAVPTETRTDPGARETLVMASATGRDRRRSAKMVREVLQVLRAITGLIG
jgi:hypothetical protein